MIAFVITGDCEDDGVMESNSSIKLEATEINSYGKSGKSCEPSGPENKAEDIFEIKLELEDDSSNTSMEVVNVAPKDESFQSLNTGNTKINW